jgi:hypothetical protein
MSSNQSCQSSTGSLVEGAAGGPQGSVAPKVRNPENPSETWAGRGLRPRWLVAAKSSNFFPLLTAVGGVAKGSAVKKTRAKRKA